VVKFQAGTKDFSPHSTGAGLGTQAPVQWVVKQLKDEADHLSPSSAKVEVVCH
jgi:hypothetical protein